MIKLFKLLKKVIKTTLSTYDSTRLNVAWYLLQGLTSISNDSRYQYKSLAVLVHSFDGYKRFWKSSVFFTELAFPSDVEVYYASESVPMCPTEQKCILTNSGSFVERLAIALKLISKRHKYVLYLQEDMWITSPLSSSDLSNFIDIMEKERLVCLKLGKFSFDQKDKDDIASSTDLITEEFRWFGNFSYSMSHHCSIFRTDFLLNTAKLALFAGTKGPQHEVFISKFFIGKLTSRNTESGKIRIAVWSNNPPVSYAHSSYRGRLTEEGLNLLSQFGIQDYYDETLEGDIFPPYRGYDHVSSKNLDRS